MNRFVMVAALAMVGACGFPEDKFTEQSQELGCDIFVNCLEVFPTVDDCVAALEAAPDPDPGCTYDAKAAKECIQALEDFVCPEDPADAEYPTVCDEVYTECPEDTSDTAGT